MTRRRHETLSGTHRLVRLEASYALQRPSGKQRLHVVGQDGGRITLAHAGEHIFCTRRGEWDGNASAPYFGPHLDARIPAHRAALCATRSFGLGHGQRCEFGGQYHVCEQTQDHMRCDKGRAFTGCIRAPATRGLPSRRNRGYTLRRQNISSGTTHEGWRQLGKLLGTGVRRMSHTSAWESSTPIGGGVGGVVAAMGEHNHRHARVLQSDAMR